MYWGNDMEYKLGRYKFKQCRWGQVNDHGHKRVTFVCVHGTPCGLNSRSECDTCRYFEPKDNLEYIVGLPKEKKSQESYNKRRNR